MKSIILTFKNFYSKDILEQKKMKTNANTFKDLFEEENIQISEFVIWDEKANSYISENNELLDNSIITLINADGQNVRRKE